MATLITKEQTTTTGEHGVSSFTEYPFGNRALSLGVSKINGLYPAAGYDVDTTIEQIWYVMEGECVVTTASQTYRLHTQDMLHLGKGEQYTINGNVTLMVASSPAWTDEQHKHIG